MRGAATAGCIILVLPHGTSASAGRSLADGVLPLLSGGEHEHGREEVRQAHEHHGRGHRQGQQAPEARDERDI